MKTFKHAVCEDTDAEATWASMRPRARVKIHFVGISSYRKGVTLATHRGRKAKAAIRGKGRKYD